MTDGTPGGGSPPLVLLQRLVDHGLRPALTKLSKASSVDPNHALTLQTMASDIFQFVSLLSTHTSHNQIADAMRDSLFSTLFSHFPTHFLASLGRTVPSEQDIQNRINIAVQGSLDPLLARLDTMSAQIDNLERPARPSSPANPDFSAEVLQKLIAIENQVTAQDHHMHRPDSPPNPEFSDEVLQRLIAIESSLSSHPVSSGPPAMPNVVASRLAALEKAVLNGRLSPAGARPPPPNARPLPAPPAGNANPTPAKGKQSSSSSYAQAAASGSPNSNNSGPAKGKASKPNSGDPASNPPGTAAPKKKPYSPVSFIARYGRFTVPMDERPPPLHLTTIVNDFCKKAPDLHGISALSVRFISSGNIRFDFPPNTNATGILSHSANIISLLPYPNKVTLSQLLPISKIVLNNVPTTIGLDSHRPTTQELRSELLRNPILSDPQFQLWADPDWVRHPDNITGHKSSIVFSIPDLDGSKAMTLIKSRFFLFGEPAFPRAWHNRPILRLCSRCLSVGHLAHQCNARQPRCRHCSQHGHNSSDHISKCTLCAQSDDEPEECPHPKHCFRCNGDHFADDLICPQLIAYSRPSANRT